MNRANDEGLALPPVDEEARQATEIDGSPSSFFSPTVLRWASGVLESTIVYGDDGLGMRDMEQGRALARYLKVQAEAGE